MLNKILPLLFAAVCCMSQMSSQSMTSSDMRAEMDEAIALKKAKKTQEALAAFLIVGKQLEAQRTETERQMYVLSQVNACQCYDALGRHKEAYLLAGKLMQGSLADDEKRFVGSQYAISGYQYVVDILHEDVKQNVKALNILEKIAPFAEGKIKGYVQSAVPKLWYAEGAHRQTALRTEEALVCFEHAQKGFRESGNDADEINAWRQIAVCKESLGDKVGLEEAYLQALSLARQTGKDDAQMEFLKELWQLNDDKGDVVRARAYAASQDSLVEATDNAIIKYEYCESKGNQAKLRGRHDIAEQWYLKAKNLAETTVVADSVRLSKLHSYQNLRDLYSAAKRYDEAVVYAQKVIDEDQKIKQPSDPDYNFEYMALADIYKKMGDERNCIRSLDKWFEDEPRISNLKTLYGMYTARARYYSAFSNHRAALADYVKADSLLATKFPQTDKSRTTLLALIGGAQYRLGDYTASEQSYRKHAECVRHNSGECSMDYFDAQIYLANIEAFAGHIDSACRDYAVAERALKGVMKQRVRYMSASEREGFWNPLSSLFTDMTPFALAAEQFQTEFTEASYDALALSKSFLLDSDRSMLDVVKREGTDEDMRDYLAITELKKQIKSLQRNSTVNSDSILSLAQKVDRMESRLAERCRGYSDGTAFMDVDYTAVKRSLKPGEVLIDFTDYVSASKGRKYAAYIIDKDDSYPLLKPLFAESQIDSLGIVRPDMYYKDDYAPDILRLLWNPLKDNVSEGATIYYVPSQLLFNISLESIPLADGSLLGNHYNFVRLSSARELVARSDRKETSSQRTAVLYGGLQYDVDSDVMAEESKKYDLTNLLATRGCVERGDSVFNELPGTREEVRKIESILKKDKWQVSAYVGNDGTEESFLSMHGCSPALLHIATHGFYYMPDKAKDVDYLKGYTDAMSLSGLVLSGGNAAWTGRKLPKDVLGGILTADDIARLDLSGTDMVVLSACQSGRGQATPEGLYGLQRAFKKAGVGTIVMSLWNVSDSTTTVFMTAFYERLTGNSGWDKHRAFEEAKAIVRQKHPDPYHWAAFVMLD